MRKVAQALSAFGQRAKDLVARYGGEEFAIVLANTTQFYLLKIAETIRKTVEDLNIAHGHSDVADRITISIGASICTPSRESSQAALLRAADKALYQAKKMGRNRVQFHEIQLDASLKPE